MISSASKRVRHLRQRGVVIPHPASLDIDPSVDLDRIAPGAILHSGCRITGADTSIGPGCELGKEAPLTLDNCQLESHVALHGGSFSGAVCLSGVSLGSCAHVRPGTLLEEQATGGHSVGLKQTVLMPFVTMGSLINFCDCLLAGGTSRKHHSEVGSSYVHFNYTPRRDKATSSLLGDVPRGVMLNQAPIFLGGQGGLLGPARIAYGTILAAGTICRRDVTTPGQLVFGDTGRRLHSHAYDIDLYGDISRIIANNLNYTGNLHALLQWYQYVRTPFARGNPFTSACYRGAQTLIRQMIQERVSRMAELAQRMPRSLTIARERLADKASKRPYSLQKQFMQRWPELADELSTGPHRHTGEPHRHRFLASLGRPKKDTSYLKTIQTLEATTTTTGSAWLQSVVDSVTGLW